LTHDWVDGKETFADDAMEKLVGVSEFVEMKARVFEVIRQGRIVTCGDVGFSHGWRADDKFDMALATVGILAKYNGLVRSVCKRIVFDLCGVDDDSCNLTRVLQMTREILSTMGNCKHIEFVQVDRVPEALVIFVNDTVGRSTSSDKKTMAEVYARMSDEDKGKVRLSLQRMEETETSFQSYLNVLMLARLVYKTV
jgi:hypothetical protein